MIINYKKLRTYQITLIIGVLLGFSSCSDDKLQTELWFEQATVAEVDAHEKKEGGVLHESQFTKEAKVYMREAEMELPLKVRYYFSKEEKVEKVMYEWSKIIPNLTPEQLDSIMVDELNNIDTYNHKYDLVAAILTEKYGFPKAGDGHLKKERFEMLDMWKREQTWVNGKQTIALNMVWVPKTGYRIFKVFCESTWEE